MSRRRHESRFTVPVLASLLSLSIAAGSAIGQTTPPPKRDNTKGTPSQPAAQPSAQPGTKPPPAPVKKGPLVEPGPYVTREQPKDWTLRTRVRVTSKAPGVDAQILASPSSKNRDDAGVRSGNAAGFSFQTLTFVLQLPSQTAGAFPSDDDITGFLRADDREVVTSPELTGEQASGKPYHSGTRLLQFATRTGSGPDEVPDGTAREILVEVDIPMTCWKTKFDENAASKVAWPQGEWPDSAKATFEAQTFVETDAAGSPYDLAELRAMVDQWTKGNPRSVTPVVLAKALAAEVVRNFQPSGSGLRNLRTGELQGFDLQGVQETVKRKRGNEFDIVCLLTAAYRAAGLPARVVIGVEAEDTDRKNFLDKKRGGSIRAWVEFALYDEANNTLNWVPVDIIKIRKTSSRPQPLDRPWRHFGTCEDLQLITPIAFHFHPPTSVIAYGTPGLWGWFITPTAPGTAYQSLYFGAFRSSKGPEDPRKTRDNTKRR